jgi:PhnB protein
MTVKTIPEGYHAVTPYLCINEAGKAINFYKQAFAAKEVMRLEAPGGKIGHAEIKIGGSHIMLADEHPDMGFLSPLSIGGTPVHIHLYVEDVDATFNRAVAAGAKAVRVVADQFYGDRSGSLTDPWGHVWHVATHIEDLTAEEINKRAAAMHT